MANETPNWDMIRVKRLAECGDEVARVLCRVVAMLGAVGLDVLDDEKGTPTPADPTPASGQEGTSMERSMAGEQDKHTPHAPEKIFSAGEPYVVVHLPGDAGLVSDFRRQVIGATGHVGWLGPGERFSDFVRAREDEILKVSPKKFSETGPSAPEKIFDFAGSAVWDPWCGLTRPIGYSFRDRVDVVLRDGTVQMDRLVGGLNWGWCGSGSIVRYRLRSGSDVKPTYRTEPIDGEPGHWSVYRDDRFVGTLASGSSLSDFMEAYERLYGGREVRVPAPECLGDLRVYRGSDLSQSGYAAGQGVAVPEVDPVLPDGWSDWNGLWKQDMPLGLDKSDLVDVRLFEGREMLRVPAGSVGWRWRRSAGEPGDVMAWRRHVPVQKFEIQKTHEGFMPDADNGPDGSFGPDVVGDAGFRLSERKLREALAIELRALPDGTERLSMPVVASLLEAAISRSRGS